MRLLREPCAWEETLNRSKPFGDGGFDGRRGHLVEASGVRHAFAARRLRPRRRLGALASVIVSGSSSRAALYLTAHLDGRDVLADLVVVDPGAGK